MNTSYGLDAYRSHDLNISMRTSSGDVIKMDFSNKQAGSFSQTKNANGISTSASFSSMQSFQFSIDSI
jgi:post-segregation antitoxin (ccd killing protein)